MCVVELENIFSPEAGSYFSAQQYEWQYRSAQLFQFPCPKPANGAGIPLPTCVSVGITAVALSL